MKVADLAARHGGDLNHVGRVLPMKVDGSIGFAPDSLTESARRIERLGYDGAWSAETSHDPFLPLAVAAEATEHLELGTSIAVAFARNPMTLAVLATICRCSPRVASSSAWGPRSSPTSRSATRCPGPGRRPACES